MTWLLVVTVCLASNGEAECRRDVRWFAEREACAEAGTLMVGYVKATEAPEIVFVGARCEQGLDG